MPLYTVPDDPDPRRSRNSRSSTSISTNGPFAIVFDDGLWGGASYHVTENYGYLRFGGKRAGVEEKWQLADAVPG